MMGLHRFDCVELRDVFATNPWTGLSTPHRQQFAVTRDVESETIPRDALWPFVTSVQEPIRMTDVVRLNYRDVTAEAVL